MCPESSRSQTFIDPLQTISKYLDLTFGFFQSAPSLYTMLFRTEASKSQIMQSPLELLLVVPKLLKDEVFQSKLQHDLLNDPGIAITLRTLFGKLLECTIKLSRCADTSHSKYNQRLQKYIAGILSTTCAGRMVKGYHKFCTMTTILRVGTDIVTVPIS